VLSQQDVEILVQAAIEEVLGSKAVKKTSSKVSKAGKYISVTTIAKLTDRQQLEETYKAVSNLDIVKMTL